MAVDFQGSDAVLRALLDELPDGIIVADADGVVMLVNKPLAQMFGYDPADLLGQPVEALIPEGARLAHDEHRAEFAARPSRGQMGLGLELVGYRRDGRDIRLDVRLSPLQTGGGGWFLATVREAGHRRADDHDETAAKWDDETGRIAREIGDTVIRGLFAAGLQLHSIASDVGDRPAEELRSVAGDLDTMIHDIRNALFLRHLRLVPAVTDRTDPAPAAEETIRLVEHFTDTPFVTVVLETLRAQQIVDLDAEPRPELTGREQLLASIIASRLAGDGGAVDDSTD
jgi:PAS domain S-box-containing protein